MLTITVPASEIYNEERNEFFTCRETELRLEHSLVSISKWESKWKKPFINNKKMSHAELIDYVKCMTITQNVPEDIYYCLSPGNLQAIGDYIQDTMTATWFNERNQKPNTEVITSELIYYWMTAFNIPWECQKWHLNRLLTLIRICSIKNQSGNKKNNMSKGAIMRENAALNKARRAKYNSKG